MTFLPHDKWHCRECGATNVYEDSPGGVCEDCGLDNSVPVEDLPLLEDPMRREEPSSAVQSPKERNR